MYKCVSEGINNACFRSRVSYFDARNIRFMALEVPWIRNKNSDRCSIVYRGPIV